MRITNKTLVENFTTNLSKNLEQMKKYQNQLSSGKEITKPSDNPMLVSRIMSLDNGLKQNEQYGVNIHDSIGWVDTSDGSLNSVSSTMLRVRELMIYGANGTLSDTDRSAIVDEMNLLVEEVAQSLNSNFDGRYIFGGQSTMEPPFQVTKNNDGVSILSYNGDNMDLEREISQDVTIKINTTGNDIINSVTATDELGVFLEKVINGLKDNKSDDLSGDLLGEVDEHIDNILRVRSKVGAISNRLDSVKAKNETEKLNMTKLLSESEDIDIAEKVMEYSVMSNVYQASLSTGAKIIQPSLLDYLR